MPWRPPDERRADVERARILREQGLTMQEIGNRLGLARNTVSDMLRYPDEGQAYRARPNKQFKLCPECGGEMAHTSMRCLACARG